jgi:hypothetical protein
MQFQFIDRYKNNICYALIILFNKIYIRIFTEILIFMLDHVTFQKLK